MTEDNILDELLGQSNGTFIINFWEHCTPACTTMEKIMFELEELLERNNTALSILRLNLIENKSWAKKYKLQGTPSILIVRDRQVVATIRGKVNLADLVKELVSLGLILEENRSS